MNKQNHKYPYLIRCSENFSINGKTFSNLPLLIDENNQVIIPVADYFRYLVLYRSNNELTITECAKAIRQFWEFICVQEIPWNEVSDHLMIAWRDWMYTRKDSPLKKRTINAKLTTIYNFYWWCELHNYVFGVIGQRGGHSFECSKCGHSNNRDIPYRLTVKVKVSTSRRGETSTSISCPITFRTSYDVDDRNPTSDEIDELYASLTCSKNPAISSRNTLMARWCEEVMLRRCEHLALSIKQIPEIAATNLLIDGDQDGWITLEKTKGSKKRNVKVDPQLLLDTREYINTYRKELVYHFKKRKGSAYKEPSNIFLSHKTGMGLSENGTSNIFSAAAKAANVSKGTQHRLRSVGATELTLGAINAETEKHGRADIETILLLTQQLLGHTSAETTKKYYIRAQQTKLNHSMVDHNKEVGVKQRLQSIQRKLSQTHKEFKLIPELHEIQKEMMDGDKEAIISKFKALLEKVTKE